MFYFFIQGGVLIFEMSTNNNTMKFKSASKPLAPRQVRDLAIPQGPAGHRPDPEDEWSDGNGY